MEIYIKKKKKKKIFYLIYINNFYHVPFNNTIKIILIRVQKRKFFKL